MILAARAAAPPLVRHVIWSGGREAAVMDHLHNAWRHAVICGVCLVGIGGIGSAPVAAQQQTAAVASDNPLSGDPDAIKAGRKLFNTFCTQCHGGDATGQSPFGKLGADLTKFSLGYTEFAAIVVAGRPDRQMPP
jgi:cytochrome c5